MSKKYSLKCLTENEFAVVDALLTVMRRDRNPEVRKNLGGADPDDVFRPMQETLRTRKGTKDEMRKLSEAMRIGKGIVTDSEDPDIRKYAGDYRNAYDKISGFARY